MQAILGGFLLTLSAVFIVVDPIPVAPMFAAMTAGRSPTDARRIARRASVAGALLLVFFALFGGFLFKILRLELGAFRVAGGLLLLLTALDMLRAKSPDCRCSPAEMAKDAQKEDISIVPLATPLLAGPGAIATVMVLTSEKAGLAGTAAVLAAIAVTFSVTYLVLAAGRHVERFLGSSGMAMLQRVMGLLLAAVAVQFIVDGARRLLS